MTALETKLDAFAVAVATKINSLSAHITTVETNTTQLITSQFQQLQANSQAIAELQGGFDSVTASFNSTLTA